MPTTALSDLCPSSPLTAAMRDRRMDKIAAFPFSVGCVSESSVAIGQSRTRRPQLEPPITQGGGGGGRQSTSKTVSLGLQKLLKSLKGFSQFFALDRKEEQEEEEEEEEEVEMEIGFPTDVQHVAHIGWNGFGNAGGIKSWGTAPECLSLHSVSHKPFELAVAAARPGPLIRV